jgi:long-chain acyl-CoA synthetase
MTSQNNVASFLLDQKREDKVVLELLSGNYTYGELRAAARSVAFYLRSVGGQKGDRVLLLSENSFFWVAAYLGTLQAGLVAVPLPKDIPAQDLEYILANTESHIAFLQSSVAAQHRTRLTHIHLVTDRDLPAMVNVATQTTFRCLRLQGDSLQPSGDPVESDDLAALMFTSGSTGQPRGVMISHANIMANTESIIQYLSLSEADRIMAVLPFHYCFGTSLLHTHLRVGGSVVVENRFLYPEKVLQRMIETECTGFAGVPSHFQILLRRSSVKEKRFPHLRYVQQAGGHLAPNFVRELRSVLPGTAIFVMYGQTEATARLSYLPPSFLDSKMGSVGKAIPGVTLQVVNHAGIPVRPGEVGEIVAEGKNIARGYWRSPEESAAVFRDGRLYTGDLATVDEDGFIYVKDRAKDFLKCGGKRVSCREIEDRLLEFDGILEAAVIGVTDDVLGEAVRAFVVPCSRQGNSVRDQLPLFCKGHLAPNLVPKEIVLLPALPKNSSGKVLKNNLRLVPTGMQYDST